MRRTHPNPVLALALDGDQLAAVLTNGTPRSLTVPLAVDPLNDDPELVAADLRDRLQPLGHLPRRAVVCLPLNRLLVTTVTVPEMPEDAVDGYLRLQAEREFLLAPEELVLGSSLHAQEGGRRGGLLVALPIARYANLQRSLRLLGVREVSVVPLPVACLDGRATAACLCAGVGGCDLVVAGAGGVVLLRRLAGPVADGQEPGPDPVVAGELRLSLSQIPGSVLRELTALDIVGQADAVAPLVAELESLPLPGALRAVAATREGGLAAAVCASLAGRVADGETPPLVLAPPLATVRYGLFHWPRRRLAAAACAAVAVLVLGLGGLLLQRWQLARITARWRELAPRVETVRGIIAEARARQAWLGGQPQTLEVLRAMTLAFPEHGSVWATRLEIHGRRTVTLTGKASSRQEWLSMLEALRQTPGVCDVRVAQTREEGRGSAALSFALRFTWQPAAASTQKGQTEARKT